MHFRLLSLLLCVGFLAGNGITIYSQVSAPPSFTIKPGQAVYLIAVKGDCDISHGMMVVNGQPIVLPPPPMMPIWQRARTQQTLARYESLPDATEILKQSFNQDKTFVVTNTLEKADFVFRVCATFAGEMKKISPAFRQVEPASQLVMARAQVIPAVIYRQHQDNLNEAFTFSVWGEMTPNVQRLVESESPATPEKKKSKNPPPPPAYAVWNGIQLTPERTTPRFASLVKYFLQDYKNIAPLKLPDIAFNARTTNSDPARPGLANKPDDSSQEKRRPALVNPQAEAEKKTETSSTTEQEDTIKIDTALIYVPVRAMDKDGKYIPDLQAKDFKIYEDGIEQEIEHFSNVDDPFNVVLLLDTSGSTRFKIEDIQDAAVTFTEQLRPQDRVMVVSFDQKVWVDSEFTNDRTKLMKAILRTRTGSSTSVYDAVDLVLTERLNKVQGRKAIVLFSDGVDTASHQATLQSTIERIEESNSILYSVHYDTRDAVIPTAPLPPNMIMPGSTEADYQRAEKYMQELANRSGGRFYEAATIGDAKQAFASIAEELRRQYGLGYYSKNDKNDGTFRKIRVQGTNTNWAIRSRIGYRAPKK